MVTAEITAEITALAIAGVASDGGFSVEVTTKCTKRFCAQLSG